MFSLIAILLILISIVLIAAVLIQPGKGDLSASFGGLGSQFGTMFGMQRTVDFVQKLTRWLAIAILILVLIANKFFLGPKFEEVKPVTQGAKPPANTMAPPPIEIPKQ